MGGYPLVGAVVAHLAADNGMLAKVGQRIYPEVRAQDGALPCVIVAVTEEESRPALAAAGSTVRKAEVELLILAATAKVANEISETIRAAMHETTGWGVTDAGASLVVMHSLHSRSLTNYQPPSAGESTGTFTHSSIYSIMYQEDT